MTQNKIQTISILGCGWYGTPLALKLIAAGYEVKGSTTSPDKLGHLKALGIIPYLIVVDHQAVESSSNQEFFKCDLLIINIPPRRNSAEKHAFLSKIHQICTQALHHHIKEIIFVSSTAVYGDHNSEVDEHTAPTPDSDSGKILLEAENFLTDQVGLRTTVIRFGGLVGPNRHPGKFLAGKTEVVNGEAPVNLVHLDDCIGITIQIISQHAFGHVFNAVAPSHPSRQTFYTQAARNTKLQEPQFIPEIKHWKIVNSVNIYSKLNYSFERPDWEDWI